MTTTDTDAEAALEAIWTYLSPTTEQTWYDGEALPDHLMRVTVTCPTEGGEYVALASWDGQDFSVHCRCDRWHSLDD